MTSKKDSKKERLQNVHRLAWSLDEASVATGLSISGLRRAIRAGNLEVVRVRRRTLILDEILKAWLASHSLPKAG